MTSKVDDRDLLQQTTIKKQIKDFFSMFGHNQIVGEKYFKDAGEKLFVTSIFYTLQGEGPYRGEPAVFVRLAKCNLACSWCDTFFDDGDWLTIEEIDARIEKTISDYFEGDVPLWARELWGGVGVEGDESPMGPLKKREMVLVVTGGEPMLQKNLVPFLEYMNKRFDKTQIESNGTIVQNIPAETTLVVSPKCSEKHGVAIKYLEPRPEMLARANCLKFVMSADAESPYSVVPDWALTWRQQTSNPVFVSPMNIYNSEPQKSKQLRANTNQITLAERSTVDEVISFWEEGLLNMPENQKNHEYTARFCAKHGLILNLQIHLYASLA
jgi:organic radical activating enzyme